MRPITPLLLTLLAGCTSYGRSVPVETIPATDSTARHKYEVWSHGSSQVLWSLRRNADTLSGVPSWKDPACDSCRVSFPSAAVDSVRVTSFDGNKTLLFAILMTPVILGAMLASAFSDSNY